MKDLDPLFSALSTDKELAELMKVNKSIFMMGLEGLGRQGIILDLEALPSDPYPLKTLFLMWLTAVNRQRLANLQEPIVTYDLVSRCPLWKVVPMPLRRISMTREGLNSTTVKTVRQQTPARGINRSRR